MENEENRCRCSFTTKEEPARSAAYAPGPGQRLGFAPSGGRAPQYRATRRAPKGSGAGSLALLLFCLLGLSLLFALAAADSDMPAVTAAAYRTAQNAESDRTGEDDADGELGKLRLIGLPGMLTVFAPSDTPIQPLPMDRITVDDDLTVKVYAPAGTEVVSVLKGTVKSVVTGGTEGGVVTVSHAGGIEITYYGLKDIRVERGQPVLQRSALGVTEGDVLRIRVTKDGRPINPADYLGAAAKLF